MSLKDAFNQDLLIQASAAAALAEVLPNVATNAHLPQTQVSIEQAIIRLLAPFQPNEPQKAQPTSERRQDGEAGTTSTVAPEGEICPGCGEIHTPEQEAHVERLRDLLESIFGKGSVELIRQTHSTKH